MPFILFFIDLRAASTAPKFIFRAKKAIIWSLKKSPLGIAFASVFVIFWGKAIYLLSFLLLWVEKDLFFDENLCVQKETLWFLFTIFMYMIKYYTIKSIQISDGAPLHSLARSVQTWHPPQLRNLQTITHSCTCYSLLCSWIGSSICQLRCTGSCLPQRPLCKILQHCPS